MPLTLELLRDCTPKRVMTFIETGSHAGRGIQTALDAGFADVVSIELSEKHHLACCARFEGDLRVRLIQGDSGTALADVVRDLDERAVIWLDSHFSGGDTARGPEETPLLRELHCLARAKRNNHVILIDDIRCWYRNVHGFDKTDLINILKVINPGYRTVFADSVLPDGKTAVGDVLIGIV